MSIKLKYKEVEYQCDTILWDRDSFFIDFNAYWSRLIASIAQKIAENTTDNWNKFNLVRTQAIKIFGINIETGNADFSSPANVIPSNTFPSLLVSGLKDLFTDKNRDSINELFHTLVEKSLYENQTYIKSAIVLKNIEVIKQISKKTKQVLITNDSKENSDLFIKEARLENYLYQVLCQTNKEQLKDFLKSGTVFITKNTYLQNLYKKRRLENILILEDLDTFSYSNALDSNLISINIYGASKGNPGRAAIGAAFYKDKEQIEEVSEFIGNQTNNFAEYTALIRALEISLERGYKNILVRADSELVVKQINKEYKVKDANIKDLFDKAYSLIDNFDSFKIIHIPREENLRADKLANDALKELKT